MGRRGDLLDIEAEVECAPDAVFNLRLHDVEISCTGSSVRCLGKEAIVHPVDNVLRLRVLLDRTSLEIFANDGEVGMSFCFLPAERETSVRCAAERGTVLVRSIVVHHLAADGGGGGSPQG